MAGGTRSTRRPVATLSSERPARKTAARPKKPTAVAADPNPSRRIQPVRYRSLRLSKRIKHPVRLSSAWKLARQARRLCRDNWRVIGGIVLIYGILNILLVRGLTGGVDVKELRSEFNVLFSGTLAHLVSGFGVFALLIGSSTSTNNSAGASTYQVLLAIIVSLALIWSYRQQLAGKRFKVRDAYYRGMYPLIPVLLILVLITLQSLPMIAGGWVFTTVVQNGIAVTSPEKFLWGVLFGLLSLLSIYMISSSIFALYIATLADMTPLKALRSARELVRYRRWTVIRKILFLPFWLFLIGSLIMLPIILLIPVAAQWLFYVLGMVGLAVGHAYMYSLYRELLIEKN